MQYSTGKYNQYKNAYTESIQYSNVKHMKLTHNASFAVRVCYVVMCYVLYVLYVLINLS